MHGKLRQQPGSGEGADRRGAWLLAPTGTSKLAMPYPAGTAGYHAGPGWDPVTGWGTPNAHVLIPLLAGSTSPGKA
jgi:hypothetical protein